MKLNMSPNTVTSRLISSLIKDKASEKGKSKKKDVDLVSIAKKLFSNKQAKMEEEEKEQESVSNE